MASDRGGLGGTAGNRTRRWPTAQARLLAALRSPVARPGQRGGLHRPAAPRRGRTTPRRRRSGRIMIVGIDIGSHKSLHTGRRGPARRRRAPPGHGACPGRRHPCRRDRPRRGGRRAIAASVERAERVAGTKIDRRHRGCHGPVADRQPGQGLLPCGRRPRPITARTWRASSRWRAPSRSAPTGRFCTSCPRYFQVDDGGPVSSPLNMEGHRLQADVHIVTAGDGGRWPTSAGAWTWRRSTPAGLVMSTLAAAEAVLTEGRARAGRVVVDLGAGVTGLACYRDGALASTRRRSPVGGRT